MNNSEQFLEFHGKRITLVAADGKFFIAIKPICEALDVHYKSQHKAISEDEILSQLSSIQRTTGADGKQYEMLCLPEKYVYGWLFSINSDSPALLAYKRECYDVLWNHFHGITTQRRSELDKRRQLKDEYNSIHTAKMGSDEQYQRLITIQNELKASNSSLKSYDDLLQTGQGSFDFDKGGTNG